MVSKSMKGSYETETLNIVTFQKKSNQFLKTAKTENDSFSHKLMLILVNFNGNRHRGNRRVS